MVGIPYGLVPTFGNTRIKRQFWIEHIGEQSTRLSARFRIEKLIAVRIECPHRIPEGPVDIGAEVFETGQLDPFPHAKFHRHVGKSHVHISLEKVPLIAARLLVHQPVRVNEFSIRTKDAFGMKSEIKLFFRRIDRPLDVQTGLVKHRCVLDIVVTQIGRPHTIASSCGVIHHPGFGITVKINARLFQKIPDPDASQTSHEKPFTWRSRRRHNCGDFTVLRERQTHPHPHPDQTKA